MPFAKIKYADTYYFTIHILHLFICTSSQRPVFPNNGLTYLKFHVH